MAITRSVSLRSGTSSEEASSPSALDAKSTRTSFQHRLGLASNVSPLNVAALTSSCFLSISFLVFLNSAQAFVLTDLLGVAADRVGSITGNLILADELLALVLVFIWGALADKIGVRWVAVSGHFLCGMAFFVYMQVDAPYPGLIFARLVFAGGASALVTALAAALAGMSVAPLRKRLSPPADLDDPSSETTSLLAKVKQPEDGNAQVAKFAGILGFSTGMGALLAVFGYLRLPPHVAEWFPIETSPKESLQRGLKWTFYLVATIALLESIFLIYGLKRASILKGKEATKPLESKTVTEAVIVAIKDLPLGLIAAKENQKISLAYLSAFATRSQSLVAAAFLPLLINNFFIDKQLCAKGDGMLKDFDSGSCREAFLFASSLTGVIQLVSLLCAPIIGYLASSFSDALVLLVTTSFGAISFLTFAIIMVPVPADAQALALQQAEVLVTRGDPRQPIVWLLAVLMGVSQIGGIVVSLAIVARSRGDLLVESGRELGGALSAAYSACGGLGILIVGKTGGSLFDAWVGSPFLVVGIIDTFVACFAAWVVFKDRFRSRTALD